MGLPDKDKEISSRPNNIKEEPELDELELDGYVISVVNFKKQRKAIKKEIKATNDFQPDETSYLPSTPKRNKSVARKLNDASLLTPPSSVRGNDSVSSHKTMLDEHSESVVKRKTVGWFGTDARVWSSVGYKTPCKAEIWED